MKKLALAMLLAFTASISGCEDDPNDLDHLKDAGGPAPADGGAGSGGADGGDGSDAGDEDAG